MEVHGGGDNAISGGASRPCDREAGHIGIVEAAAGSEGLRGVCRVDLWQAACFRYESRKGVFLVRGVHAAGCEALGVAPV